MASICYWEGCGRGMPRPYCAAKMKKTVPEPERSLSYLQHSLRVVALNAEPGGQQAVVQLAAGLAVRRVQEQAGRDPCGGIGQLRAEVSQNRDQYNRHRRAGDHLGHTGQHSE